MKTFFKSLQVKLIVLLVLTTLITSILSLSIILFSARNLREAPPTISVEFPYENLSRRELREKLTEQIQEDRQSQQRNLLFVIFIILGFQVGTITLGSIVIVRNSLSPLNRLNKVMKEINSLQLDNTISTKDADLEIASLIDNFNSMIKRIHSMVEKEKEFLHNISHEIKTPLSAIRVNVESILLEDTLDIETSDTLNTVIYSIDSLNKLIDDLALLTVIEKKKFKTEEFKVDESIAEVIADIKSLYKRNDLQIQFIINSKKTSLNGSKELFKRAVSNLIENSIKYSKVNPEITINLSNKQNKIVISIKDNGVGISKANLKKIFDRFYRVDESRSKKTGGVGLGLSLVKEIITSFNGRIEVYSEIGEGSEFIIEI